MHDFPNCYGNGDGLLLHGHQGSEHPKKGGWSIQDRPDSVAPALPQIWVQTFGRDDVGASSPYPWALPSPSVKASKGRPLNVVDLGFSRSGRLTSILQSS